jgi:hypothetical protein
MVRIGVGLGLKGIGVIELSETFAAQAPAGIRVYQCSG